VCRVEVQDSGSATAVLALHVTLKDLGYVVPEADARASRTRYNLVSARLVTEALALGEDCTSTLHTLSCVRENATIGIAMIDYYFREVFDTVQSHSINVRLSFKAVANV